MFGMGFPELAIVAVIAVVLFGSSRLPQLGKGFGEAIAGFRGALKGPQPNSGEREKSEHKEI